MRTGRSARSPFNRSFESKNSPKLSTKPSIIASASSPVLSVSQPPTPKSVPAQLMNSTPSNTECSSPGSISGSVHSSIKGSVASVDETPVSRSVSVNTDEQIKVAVRVRPLLSHEKEISDKKSWEWNENSIQLLETEQNIFNLSSKNVKQAYQFDHLFSPESTNEIIFDSVVKNIVYAAMEGFHGSIFTYGQTSSGKTFTMNGDKNQPGILPQAIAECFDAVNNMPGRDFILRVSYLEVYNEQIKDLLSMDVVPVRIQYDPKKGTVLTGVKEQVVLNTSQVLALIKAGEAQRHVGSTDMNEKSSRAHTLFKIIIESTPTSTSSSTSSNTKEAVKVSTLYLVDLAGSESAKMTNSKGERAREAKHINQSLLTLSTIIQRLSEDRSSTSGNNSNTGTTSGSASKKQHLPYRDSKLTRILESALDGNAHIGIICTISPTIKCIEESTNTLKFATRAKMIKMKAKINENYDDKTLLRVYKQEIEELRLKLKELEVQTFNSNNKQSLLNKNQSSDDNLIHNNIRNNTSSSTTTNTTGIEINTPNTGNSDQSNGAFSEQGDDEDANLMLQMISEMERLILRADVRNREPIGIIQHKQQHSTPVIHNNNNNSSSSSYGSSSSSNINSNSIGKKNSKNRSLSFDSNTKSPSGVAVTESGSSTGSSRNLHSGRSKAGINSSYSLSPSAMTESVNAARLRPKHLPPSGSRSSLSPRTGSGKKKAPANSSAALLSLIVEATDSDTLVRIDTLEESDHESGTEPDSGGSDSMAEEEEEEVRVIRKGDVLYDILAAVDTETDAATVTGDPLTATVTTAVDNNVETVTNTVLTETSASEMETSETRLTDQKLPSTDTTTGSTAAEAVEVDELFTLSEDAMDSIDSPKFDHSSTTIPASTPDTTKPAASATAERDRTATLGSTSRTSSFSGIPRPITSRARSQLRSGSMDSEGGGDERSSVGHSLAGDSSWDEDDVKGVDTRPFIVPTASTSNSSDAAVSSSISAPVVTTSSVAAVATTTSNTTPSTNSTSASTTVATTMIGKEKAAVATAVPTTTKDKLTTPIAPAATTSISQTPITPSKASVPSVPPPTPTTGQTGEQRPPGQMVDVMHDFCPGFTVQNKHTRSSSSTNSSNAQQQQSGGGGGSLQWPLLDDAEDDSVLLGVSKMLLVLKGHVSKARSR